MKKYTKKEMIKHLKKHYLKNPKITVKSFGEDKTVCCSRTVLTKFESWDKALEAAEIGKRVQLLRLLLEHYSENPNLMSTSLLRRWLSFFQEHAKLKSQSEYFYRHKNTTNRIRL